MEELISKYFDEILKIDDTLSKIRADLSLHTTNFNELAKNSPIGAHVSYGKMVEAGKLLEGVKRTIKASLAMQEFNQNS